VELLRSRPVHVVTYVRYGQTVQRLTRQLIYQVLVHTVSDELSTVSITGLLTNIRARVHTRALTSTSTNALSK